MVVDPDVTWSELAALIYGLVMEGRMWSLTAGFPTCDISGHEACSDGGWVLPGCQWKGQVMSTTTASVDVNRPIDVVYNQSPPSTWSRTAGGVGCRRSSAAPTPLRTQFESFPEFMEGVERIEQRDDTHLHWVIKVGGITRELMPPSPSSIPRSGWPGSPTADPTTPEW